MDKNQPPEPELGHADFAATHTVLLQAGVHEPWATRLARMPHVDAEYVRGHIERAHLEGRGIGAAIYRMRLGWRVVVETEEEAAAVEARKIEARRAEAREKMRRFMES